MEEIESGKDLEGKIDPKLKKVLKDVLERRIEHADDPDEEKLGEYSLNELYSGVISETPVGIRFAEICKAYLENRVGTVYNLLDTVKDFNTYEQ